MLRKWYWRLGAALAALLALALSTASPAAAESARHVVKTYRAALDRHDFEGALGLFDPDAEVTVALPGTAPDARRARGRRCRAG